MPYPVSISTGRAFLKTTLKTTSPSGKTMKEQLDTLEAGIGPQLVKIASSAKKFMSQYIDSKRKRRKDTSKPRLASAFRAGEIKFTTGGVSLGLGEPDYLDVEFPYWKILNYGGMINIPTPTGGVLGWFGHKSRPEQGANGTELFHEHGYDDNPYLMVPKKPIIGIHYLEATNNWIASQWGNVWDAYVKQNNNVKSAGSVSKAVSKTGTSIGANAGLAESDLMKLSY